MKPVGPWRHSSSGPTNTRTHFQLSISLSQISSIALKKLYNTEVGYSEETSFGGESQGTKLMKDYVRDLYKRLNPRTISL